MANPTEKPVSPTKTQIYRRDFMACMTAMGLSTSLLPKVLWAKIQENKTVDITKEMLIDAEKLASLQFTDVQRDLMLEGLNDQLKSFEKLRTVPIDNSTAPALQFNPIPSGMTFDKQRKPIKTSKTPNRKLPADLEELAFWPVTDLAQLIRTRKITSTQLTNMYIGRLKRYDSELHCVVTMTEDLARQQAERADSEIVSGHYRGPLHGIPWGAKDLLATKGYKTTWGATPYKDQVLDYDAAVVKRLDRAGAVLIAKLTLGALAWGDVWFGGKTRNPWNTEQGSSGSSAGPASATAAGLVALAIGSETWGSIVSPSTVCGTTGLRPTFGAVSRYGAMALSWSMDKIGPICRTVEDCAIVFDAIYGPDGKDATVADITFNFDADLDLRKLKVGYLKTDFERDRSDKQWQKNDMATLDTIRSLGINLVEIKLPDYPISAMNFILNAEAAAAFSQLTLSGQDDTLVRQVKDAWPNVFRKARMIPAVEYIQANRLRTLTMQAMHKIMADIDVYLAPSWEGDNLLLTNLTGHPAVVLPNGFKEDATPTSITFNGRLYGEAQTLALAKAYQDATDFHLKHPKLKG